MKVLFVCQGNMFRSQAAEAIFNLKKRDTDEVRSEGIWVEKEHNTGKKLREFRGLEGFFEVMSGLGTSVLDNKCKLINASSVEWADKIFVMADREIWPDYLKNNPKVTHWEIENPDIVTRSKAEEIIHKIKKLVSSL